jgi:hypothetical protein
VYYQQQAFLRLCLDPGKIRLYPGQPPDFSSSKQTKL